MPELPDVEIFRQYFNRTSLHKKIINTEVKSKDMLGEVSSRSMQQRLKNQIFTETKRHGKYLFAKLDNNYWLILHFGMTGFLNYYKNEKSASNHIRLLIHFNNNYKLAFNCQRKFGLIESVKNLNQFIEKKELGIDPLDQSFTKTKFLELLDSKKGNIKTALMDQKFIAGIGNIYSDEILYQTGIYPGKMINKLSVKNKNDIYSSLKKIIYKAIDIKVDDNKFPKSYLLNHRKAGGNCPKCPGKIKKETIGGRSAYFCSKHQT